MNHHTVVKGALAAIALTALLAPAVAQADTGGPSCVGQLASSDAGPKYGQVVSSFAHDAQPFGSVVSYNATSAKDACPFGP